MTLWKAGGRMPFKSPLARTKAACVVVMNGKGKVLAVERPGSNGKLMGLPGGHVEAGELVSMAVEREAAEEAGVILTNPKVVYEHPEGKRDVTCYVAGYIGTPWSSEGLGVGWVAPAELCDSRRCPFAAFNRGLFASMRKQGFLL